MGKAKAKLEPSRSGAAVTGIMQLLILALTAAWVVCCERDDTFFSSYSRLASGKILFRTEDMVEGNIKRRGVVRDSCIRRG